MDQGPSFELGTSCAVDNGGCDPLVACSMGGGTVDCGPCPEGYSGSGVTGCVDVDECASDNGGCGSAAFYACTNRVGAAPTCADIDECTDGTAGCDLHATCVNQVGAAAECICEAGYVGDGMTCALDPCDGATVCAGTWPATSTPYSFECVPRVPTYVCQGQLPTWDVTDDALTRSGRFEVRSGSDGVLGTADDTVLDLVTSLEWERLPPSGTYTQAEAVVRCQGLSIAGGGFRLPEKSELESLVDPTRANPAIDTSAFPQPIGTSYWSRTPYVPGFDQGFSLTSFNGRTEIAADTSAKSARCVR